MKYKYFRIEKTGTSPSGKTDVLDAVDEFGDAGRLGQIRWYAPWRQYAFFPDVARLFTASCLVDLADALMAINATRKGHQ